MNAITKIVFKVPLKFAFFGTVFSVDRIINWNEILFKLQLDTKDKII